MEHFRPRYTFVSGMARILAYLVFKGNCKAAMRFYQQCLGGSLEIKTVENSPVRRLFPKEAAGMVLHASLKNMDMVLLGSDMAGPGPLNTGNAMGLTLCCDDVEELLGYFKKLSEGGQVTHIPRTFFGGTIAGLNDRFGRSWMLYVESAYMAEEQINLNLNNHEPQNT